MMSQTISPETLRPYGLQRVCTHWDVPRSTYYSKKKNRIRKKCAYKKRGPKAKLCDQEVVERIKKDIATTPFKGEGHKKIHARLKKQGAIISRNRVLKLMKQNKLLSPHRRRYVPRKKHDGKIITAAPNIMWCSDGTKIFTVDDGWVWVFTVEEHWNAECLGWHVCKKGDRFAALKPVTQAVKKVYGFAGKGIATGLKLRIDHGTQYTSDYFLQQIKYMGIQKSFGLVKQPQTNGVVERFNRTLKEQICKGSIFRNIEELKEAVRTFISHYNAKWLLAKLGYKSPMDARKNYYNLAGAA